MGNRKRPTAGTEQLEIGRRVELNYKHHSGRVSRFRDFDIESMSPSALKASRPA
jgi:hypothetical protein